MSAVLAATSSFSTRFINKDLSKAQLLISNFSVASMAPAFQSAFPHLTTYKNELVKGLSKRINQPWLINQGLSSLCGPAAFMYCLAKDAPQLYVQYVIDLYTAGKAKLNQLSVTPSRSCLQSTLHASMDVTDWVALASLRDSGNSMLSYAQVSDEAAGITMPNHLAAWFSQAGYAHVEDHTNIYFDKDIENLLDAQREFIANKNVCLFISAKALSPPFAVSIIPNHWVVQSRDLLVGSPLASVHTLKAMDIKDKVFSLPVFTWGQEAFDLNQKKLSLYDFTDYYFGYIVAS